MFVRGLVVGREGAPQFLSMYVFPGMLGFSHTMVAGSKSKYFKRQEVEVASHLGTGNWHSLTSTEFYCQTDTEPIQILGEGT